MLESLRVPAGNALARGEQLLEPLELRDPERAEHVRQPVVETGLRDVERPARDDAVMAQAPDRVGELRVVGRDGAALPGRDDLPRMEGEAAHQRRASRRAAAVARAERAGRVLDEHDLLRTAVCSASQSTGRPNRWTASTAFVRGVTASTTARGRG